MSGVKTISTFQIAPWFMALRPKTLTAAFVPVVAASFLVLAQSRTPKWWVCAFALLSSFFIQIGTNFINDALDFRKGADTSERLGPQRVTQSGLLGERQVLWGAALCFALATALGIPLVMLGGWPIVFVGVVSLFCGYAYTGGPFPLAYRGLGDVFVIVFFGFVAVMGTYFLHTGFVDIKSAVLGLQIGLLATVLIAVNNLRDVHTDSKAGKMTLAVRLGERGARLEILLLCTLPFLLGGFWLSQGHFGTALLPFLSLPLALTVVRGVYKHSPGVIYNRLLAKAAALHLLFGMLLCLSFLF